jgi:hypothetical protein
VNRHDRSWHDGSVANSATSQPGESTMTDAIRELNECELEGVSGGANLLFQFLGLKVIYEENIPQGGTLYQACVGDSCVQWISK